MKNHYLFESDLFVASSHPPKEFSHGLGGFPTFAGTRTDEKVARERTLMAPAPKRDDPT